MSNASMTPAAGTNPGAGYDAQIDYRSLEQIQQGTPGGQTATQSYSTDGVDLRSADEISRGGMPATMPTQAKDKGPGFVSDVGTGFVRAAKNTFRGVVLLGKGVVGVVANPGETRNKIATWGTYAAQHPGQAVGRTLSLPFRMAGAAVQPYTDAIKTGRPGLAVGQLGFDVGLAYATTKAVDVLKNGNKPQASPGYDYDYDYDNAGTMSGNKPGRGGLSGGRGAGAGSQINQKATVGNVKVGNINIKGNNNVINIGSNSGTSNGGTSAVRHTAREAFDSGFDDMAGTMSRRTPRVQNLAKTQSMYGQYGQYGQYSDDLAYGAVKEPGFFKRLFGSSSGSTGSSWQGTRNLASPKSTFQQISQGIDNGVGQVGGVTNGIGNAFNNTASWLDRGLANLTRLDGPNLLQAAKNVGNAVIKVPRFILDNPGTSLKYAVAGSATAVYATGTAVINGARFVVTNPMQAAVLVAATGRTLGALPVRNEQRSSATFDPDL
ncbi:MAG: hypothetical protein H7338_20040 [Candidatus Sericytochromatia bacterium]|nr:hypothetical protein [Candidatus Sericytochromatia bacterium]